MRRFPRSAPLLSRRSLLVGTLGLVGAGRAHAFETAPSASADEGPAAPVTGEDAVWRRWTDGWAHMQSEVTRHGWDLVPLSIAPPASDDDIRSLEARHQVVVPSQFRRVLTHYASTVTFGWSIPILYRPFDGLDLPSSGGLRDTVWSLDHIDDQAIKVFAALKADLATSHDGEEPNAPEMWEHQFPFASLDNGDALTIDTTLPDGPQPVRYFSEDLEGLHHHVLAPDFLSFVTAYTALGCAGGDQDEWFRFIDDPAREHSPLDPESRGGRRWQAWLARDPTVREPDEPPRPVPAKTRSDFDLLDAGRLDSAFGIAAALAAGAVPDCVDASLPNREGLYDITFDTALVYAVRRSDRDAVQSLLAAGAPIDTRLLSVGEAIKAGTSPLVPWLLAHGARANGWAGDRWWPLFLLLTGKVAQIRSDADTLPVLQALLGAGADPNARWDGGRTMVMVCRTGPMAMLLDHGADAKLFDADGDTALHLASSPEAVRLLASHGGDPNALTNPTKQPGGIDHEPPHTPYQAHLQANDDEGVANPVLGALVTAGADPLKRDGAGRSTLWYCRTVADAKRLIAQGLDPKERDAAGRTLLFGLVLWYGAGLPASKSGSALFGFYMGLGLDINARDKTGRTVLHLAAQNDSPDEITFLLGLGADKTIRDDNGRRPVDEVPPDQPKLRDLLRV